MNFSIDIEADGPIPGPYSMTEFGLVIVDGTFKKTFHGQMKPISDNWDPSALAVSNRTREEVLTWRDPKEVMGEAIAWVKFNTPKNDRALFWSDNNGFDFSFWHWYAHFFCGEDPFSYTSVNLKNILQGQMREFNVKKQIKKWKKTPHTHHPVEDATGNAEVIWEILLGMGGKKSVVNAEG